MRAQIFIFNDQRMDLLSCFNYCNQIKIDNEQDAKICESCQPKLEMEYISKFVKCETVISGEEFIISTAEIQEDQELSLDSECNSQNEATLKCNEAEIKTETVTYQIIFPEQVIKEEPDLQIDEDGVGSVKSGL
jgi:hypothetical protein